jgi:hypothetical protein
MSKLGELDRFMLDKFKLLREKFPQKPVRLEYSNECWCLEIGSFEMNELLLLYQVLEKTEDDTVDEEEVLSILQSLPERPKKGEKEC